MLGPNFESMSGLLATIEASAKLRRFKTIRIEAAKKGPLIDSLGPELAKLLVELGIAEPDNHINKSSK